MLLVTESAPANQRGYYGAFAQAGVPVGVILANLAFIVTSSMVSEESFFAWGWRIPFLASAILIGISMYIQLNLEDTKAFKELEESRKVGTRVEIKSSPIIEAIKKYPSKIVLAAGAFLSIQVTFYILIAFLLAYGVASTEVTRDHMLIAVLIGSGIMIPFQFFFSAYSDRHGRRGVFMLGAILTAVWSFAIFPLVDTGNFWLIVLAISLGLVFVSMMYGPQAAFFTELFSTEVRYSGATLGYQFGAILGGAFAPTIAALLWNDYGIIWVSVYIAFASLLTLISVLSLTETYQSDLNQDSIE
jgi:MFS family permease